MKSFFCREEKVSCSFELALPKEKKKKKKKKRCVAYFANSRYIGYT